MNFKGMMGGLILVLVLVCAAEAQRPICINGRCAIPNRQPILSQPLRIQPLNNYRVWQTPIVLHSVQDLQSTNTIILSPLQEEVFVEASQLEAVAQINQEDRFDQITRATVRVTINNVCGSGTIVGRDGQGNAIVLTNAHVAGTSRGRTANLERWDPDGTSERGQGAIIAAGYGRGMSVDFALLKCNAEFARDVTPIPLADRYPAVDVSVTTFGCPRCEWPSLQVLKMNRAEGQVLTWKPEAIGGRSGSSIVDHTDSGPRVVGLLTWGGNGEGLGQSTPFLLSAMKGRLPKSLESLPQGVREVDGRLQDDESDKQMKTIYQVPATTQGEALELPIDFSQTSFQVQDDLIDSITESEPDSLKPDPDDSTENGLLDRNREPRIRPEGQGPIGRGLDWMRRVLITAFLCVACAVIGFFAGRMWK